MEERRIKEIREKTAALLAEERLKEAIATLSTDIDELQEWGLRTRFTQMKSAYDYLLEYMRGGTPDPGRESMHNTLMGECYMLNDQIALTRKAENRATYTKTTSIEELPLLHTRLRETCANIKITNMLPQSECEKVKKELVEEYEAVIDKIFFAITHSIAWNKSNAEHILAIIDDEEIATSDKAIITSAITLSLINCFEPAKALALVKIAIKEESTTIATRAITGCIIGILLHDERIAYYPEVVAAIEALHTNPHIAKQIATIQIQLLRCRETQKIDRKMREEIIPAMMKNPHIGDKMGIDIMREIEQDDDKNPEWKEWVDKDEIKEKLEEMTQWQFEGADVYMSTFSQLKNYPFFKQTRNWFRPFDINDLDMFDINPTEGGIKKTLLWAICSSRFFCNSDKFSFLFTVKQLPENQRGMLMQQLGGDEEMKEQMPDTIAKSETEKRSEIESNQYIQDLYRFFKLSPMRREYIDPFTQPLNLLESASLKNSIEDAESVLRVFSYLINKGYYDEAVSVGQIYEKMAKCDAQFYQEMGYCLQKEKQHYAAIDYYTRADIIKPDTLWTLMHIAQCYRLAGDCDKAIGYYILAEDIAPDNISLLRQMGECFASLKQYDEAFARLFKVEYLKPGTIKTLRGIAWCSFLTGKYEQARSYYKKITTHEKATYTDFLNAAHTEWMSHENSVAVELYKKAKELCNNDELFFSQFTKDCDILQQHGTSKNECTLLRDLIA